MIFYALIFSAKNGSYFRLMTHTVLNSSSALSALILELPLLCV